jgi:K+-transporting ATPase ATPase A chain
MDSIATWLHPTWAIAFPVLASVPLGWFMWRVLDVPADREGRGLDALPMLILRLFGRRKVMPMDWKRYAYVMLTFSAVAWVLSFAILYFQPYLPLNPDKKGPLSGDLIFHTASSFVSNTQLQHYSGEQHLSYFSQLGMIVWLDFVGPATGLAVMLATVRGLRGDRKLGDFYADLVRSVVWVLMPLSVIVALMLMATGVPMTYEGSAQAKTVEGGSQTIARGPVAAFVSIKQLGTDGGGFFGPNSTHPFENPTAWSNMIEEIAISLLPMAAIVMIGFMIRDLKHAAVIFSVMLAFLIFSVAVAIYFENKPSAATEGLPVVQAPNMEGKEVRVGVVSTATWATLITAIANGSVNGMHDSLNPITGLVPMGLMQLNVVFSGMGSGFLNMLAFIIVAVFLSGLMVGRTPEYLGKKLEARETKFAMLIALFHPLLILICTGWFAATEWGTKTVANPGPHGFSEILYEFTSASSNNGSGFEGLADNNPPWNIVSGVVLLLNRFGPLVLPLAIAGSLAMKKRVPQTSGTLRTDNFTFAGMLMGTVILVGVLSFMPAVVLGPIADHLSGPTASQGAPAAPAPPPTTTAQLP